MKWSPLADFRLRGLLKLLNYNRPTLWLKDVAYGKLTDHEIFNKIGGVSVF